MTNRVAVLGAGAWGLTLADLLCSKGMSVAVWDCDSTKIARLRETRDPGKPPGLRLAPDLRLETDLSAAIAAASIIVSVVPSFAVRDVCASITDRGGLKARLFISCSKGITEDTLLLPSQVFASEFGDEALDQYAALSGPSHAEEVCRRIPTTVVSSSRSAETAAAARDLFLLPEFRVYTQADTLGVELGAALKNVIAIAAGVCDGLGFGDNTKAALITRGLAEIARAGAAMGAQPQTLAGLAGLGDLVVTATSRHSRNRQFGELLARGRTPAAALAEVGAVVEGYRTSRSAHQLANRLGIEMPLSEAVYRVCHEGMSVRDATDLLLSRDPKPEVY